MDIFITNLPFKFKEESLRVLFEEIGSVDSINLVKDRRTGQFRGYAFVSMHDPVAAQVAAKKLNGAEIEGRVIKVEISKKENVPDKLELVPKNREIKFRKKRRGTGRGTNY